MRIGKHTLTGSTLSLVLAGLACLVGIPLWIALATMVAVRWELINAEQVEAFFYGPAPELIDLQTQTKDAETITLSPSYDNCYIAEGDSTIGSGWIESISGCARFEEEHPGCVVWYLDRDGDGLGSKRFIDSSYACVQPPGYVDNSDDDDDEPEPTPKPVDCYPDRDGDGAGAMDSEIVTTVTGDQECPSGTSKVNCDYDDQDPTSHTPWPAGMDRWLAEQAAP